MNLFDAAQSAPSVRLMVSHLTRALVEQKKSLLVLVPAGISAADVGQLLRDDLVRRDVDFRDLYLEESDTSSSPALVPLLGIGEEFDGQPIEKLLKQAEHNQYLPQILFVNVPEQADALMYRSWCDVLSRWSQVMEGWSKRSKEPIRLCLIDSAVPWLDYLPTEHQALGVEWWWGVPSVIESQVLYRASAPTQGSADIWHEQLIPLIAAGDLELARFLDGKIAVHWPELPGLLKDYALTRCWDRSTLLRWNEQWSHRSHDLFGLQPLMNDQHVRRLWASGALQWTREYGLELSIAACALLDQSAKVNYRLWRAQVQFLLTFVNRLRLIACDQLAAAYGPDWPIQHQMWIDETVRSAVCADPTVCEFGTLKSVLENCDRRIPQSWRYLIRSARKIRNDIAHYKPVSYAAFKDLWERYGRILT